MRGWISRGWQSAHPGARVSDSERPVPDDICQRVGYRAQPARAFQFDEIQAAHRALELGAHAGKLVVVV